MQLPASVASEISFQSDWMALECPCGVCAVQSWQVLQNPSPVFVSLAFADDTFP